MIAYLGEIGHFSLILGLGLATLQVIFPLWGAKMHNFRLMASARALALGQFVFVLLSFLLLTYAFVLNDFSIQYVAKNSNTTLPIEFRIAAVWGAHEGSLLLWALILSGWGAAVARFSRALPLDFVARVLAIMAMIGIGFYLFILFTSNPFERTLPYIPVNGTDLNPLLQDIGLIFHPPMLYMGYVGFSVAFAFAIAALMVGRLDSTWARWSRPWTMAAWLFLTLGIALGSWWAYYELGWGGWWFWDPVENASLMPWLAGTALLHSLAVSEKRAVFKAWTVLLAIGAFSLSLLGTFLVRSGVLVSVHAFASDPDRGLFILGFLVVVIGGSLLLFAIKGTQVKSRGQFELFSRETFLLLNNIVLAAALLVVLLGTLLPLIHKELGLGSISIGEAFFNTVIVWLMVPFVLIMGIGPLLRWKRQCDQSIAIPLAFAGAMTLMGTLLQLLLFADQMTMPALLGIAMGLWIVITTLLELYLRATFRAPLLSGLARLGRSHWAMSIAHLGFAVMIIGISMTQSLSIEKDLRMRLGESVDFSGYQFTFMQLAKSDGANYDGFKGVIRVSQGRQTIAILEPEKRFYQAQGMPMTEAAIDAGVFRDLYAALGEELADGSWAVRLYYKPFIRWIWFGAIIMSLGAGLAMFDKRYRISVNKHQLQCAG